MQENNCEHNWNLHSEIEIIWKVAPVKETLLGHWKARKVLWELRPVGWVRHWYCTRCRYFQTQTVYTVTLEDLLAEGLAVKQDGDWILPEPPSEKGGGSLARSL